MEHIWTHADPNDFGGFDYSDAIGQKIGYSIDGPFGGHQLYDAKGVLKGYSHDNPFGGTDYYDSTGHMKLAVMNNAGATHFHDGQGHEIATAHHSPFGGEDLFTTSGDFLGHLGHSPSGGWDWHGDPLVGMHQVKFPEFGF